MAKVKITKIPKGKIPPCYDCLSEQVKKTGGYTQGLIGNITNPDYLKKGGKKKATQMYPFQDNQGGAYSDQGPQGLPGEDMGGIISAIPYKDMNTFGNQKKGGWIKGAVNPAHKGFCSPMTKSTCTPKRKAFAETMKKHHGFHKAEGGEMPEMDEMSGTYNYKRGGATTNDTNAITNKGMPNYNPYVYFKNKNWYMTTNPEDANITSTMKPIDREDANIEAERGEYLVKPGLAGLYKIGGEKHSAGGTPLYADGGSFIFSNDPKLAITRKEKQAFGFKDGGSNAYSKNTPAKVLGRELDPKEYNSYLATLEDDKTDKIAKTTAALMLQKRQQTLGQIAYLQEAKKNKPAPSFSEGTAPVQKPEFQDIDERMSEYKQGGMKYPGGGGVNPFMNNQFAGDLDTQGLDFPPDKTGKWAGDYGKSKNPQTGQPSTSWNAMTDFGSPQEYATQVGYPGKITGNPQSIKEMQQWIGQKYPDLVNQFHGSPQQGGYGQPAAGTPYDGKLGVRWNAIGQAITNKKATPDLSTIPISPLQSPDIAGQFGPPQAPIMPGQQQGSQSTPTLPYDIKGKLTDQQMAHLGYLGLQAFNINRYYPKREQVSLPQVRFDQVNAQPQLNQINNQAYAANQLAALNPRTASLINSNIRGSSIDQANQVLGNVANQNVQIGNQQNQFNTQQSTQQVMANSQFDNTYHNQVNATNQNFDNERRFASNQFMSNLNQYQSQDDALAWQLASVNKYGLRKVTDPKTGKQFNMPVPLFEATGNGIKYNADVANLNMAPNGNKIDTPQEIYQAYNSWIQQGMDQRTARTLLADIIKSKTNKGGVGQGPFSTFQNPYGSY